MVSADYAHISTVRDAIACAYFIVIAGIALMISVIVLAGERSKKKIDRRKISN